MKRITTSLSIAALAVLSALCSLPLTAPARAQNPNDPYPLTADSKPQDGVPKGEVLHFTFDHSTIFPGTTQDYWVYVPAQYKPGVGPAPCLYVNQDGIQWNAPTVFDNLIARGEMPVTIGVFVMHGRVPAADPKTALDRFNRSYEYDGVGPNYANFLLNELLPQVETKETTDGRAIHFSHDGKDHAIGGSSSGAVAAFTAAWERPDAFSRVFSVIGTYVGLRGGNEYPTLIRKYEPKPLRVFLNDGENDLNIYGGDWWMANQTMERALTFAGYDVQHVWGTLGHDGRQGAMLFPDAMRFLWKGWPAPVAVAGPSKNDMLGQILAPGVGWEQVGGGIKEPFTIAASTTGIVEVIDVAAHKRYQIQADGAATAVPSLLYAPWAETYGPHGERYEIGILKEEDGLDSNLFVDANAKPKMLTPRVEQGPIVVMHNGNIFTASEILDDVNGRPTGNNRSIFLQKPGGERKSLATLSGFDSVFGMTVSPDQTLLYVSDNRRFVRSYQIQPDDSLKYGQSYYWLHLPDETNWNGGLGMSVDRDGRLYVATDMGIQVCDQAGRVNVILPLPGNVAPTALAWGGPNFDTLYAITDGKVYRRKMNVRGANAWDVPNRPAPPGL